MSGRATDTDLQDARIEIVNGEHAGEELPVLFNPTEYSMNKSLQYDDQEIAGLTTPVSQFVSGDAETLSLELFIDARGIDPDGDRDLLDYVQFVDRLLEVDDQLAAPPVCRFLWGPLEFKAVVESVDREFTLFDRGGVPIRARLNVTFKEYRPPGEQGRGRWGSERTQARRATEGDTLAEVAARAYGDPSKWRLIAEANDIDDPTDVLAGADLVIPPVTDR